MSAIQGWEFEAWVLDTGERPAVVVGHATAENDAIFDKTIKVLREHGAS